MKKLAISGILLIFIGLIISPTKIADISIKNLLKPQKIKVSLDEKNDYYRNYDFAYVQNTNDFSPDCKQDILNIYYTVINAGKENFTFYCPSDYQSCQKDIEEIANNEETLSLINNYVHPYNSFKHIETEFNNQGKITITIFKSYTENDILEIENKINEIIKSTINSNNTLEENIKLTHDYIINSTQYDSARIDQNNLTYKSDIAYGPLLQGYGICSGYADAMQLILEKLNVENFKVASANHIWNAVKINNEWKHLDLTWDDPILDIPIDWIIHDYFLISTEDLYKIDQTEHTFNQDIYTELKIQNNI